MAATTGVSHSTTGEMKPAQLHNDRPLQLHTLAVKLRNDTLSTLEAAGVFRNCLTCLNFLEVMELCEKHGQRPPARIIAYGCPDHSDIIPF